jgi:ABC-type multidrug transport system fused ATPase/permease subunit
LDVRVAEALPVSSDVSDPAPDSGKLQGLDLLDHGGSDHSMDGLRHLLPRLLRHPWLLAGSIFCAIFSAGGLGIGLVSMGPLLRIILEGRSKETVAQLISQYNASRPGFTIPESLVELLPTSPFHAVVVIMVGLAILTIFGATANFLHQFLALELSNRAVAEVRTETFQHALAMPLGEVQRRGAAELVSRINKDSMALQSGMLALTSKTVSQLTKGLAAFAAAVWFDWRLTIVALLVAPVLASILRKLGRRIRHATRAALVAQEDLLRVSNEAIQGIRTVKTATAESLAGIRFEVANQDVLREELRVRTARAISSPLIEMLAVFVLIGLATLAARQILDGKMDFDSFMLSLAALGVAGGSLKPLAGLVNDIQASAAPAERLEELLAIPDEHQDTQDRPDLLRHSESIQFEGVRFRYPGADRDSLQGIDLEIRFGEHVAIVGPNGCGKTTLLALLPRLFDPTSGTVSIDGHDLREIRLESLRNQIGVVTQETVLFSGTIRENISFGLDVSDEAIRAAAGLAHASAFIEAMPLAYETPVAELGTSLSGGQRQRIVIARALLREPSLLILDEATSQIDAESEEQINLAIAKFRSGRTLVVIAHRLSTVLAADRIVVMDEGRTMDVGTHSELMGRCEVYRRLAQTQLMPG